jgi:LPXTG-site transpeptidase (sortase) family protein
VATHIEQHIIATTASANTQSDLPTRRERVTWTLGSLLMLAGVYVLLYVGGVYATIEYQRMAARGDNNLPAPAAIVSAPQAADAPVAEQISTDGFSVPVLSASGAILSTVPEETQSAQASTVSRIVIPSINVDSKTIEVGWEIQEQDGQQVAVWQVAEYAVGHHKGSANPGEGGNIVLAGHVGGYGLVFRDLFYVQPGDDVLLYTQDQQHRYIVQERLVLDEVGVSAEQRAANARYIEPTDEEMVTLVTCWPASGPERFTQRIIVRATPAEIIQNNMPDGVR